MCNLNNFNHLNMISGFSTELQANREGWNNTLLACSMMTPLSPTQKSFKPKMGLLRLSDYRNSNPGKNYWAKWPVNRRNFGKSQINGLALRELALASGYKDLNNLEKVTKDLTEGAKIGC